MDERVVWARVALMGHTVLYGAVRSEERFGVVGLRLDVPPTPTRPGQVHWYAPGALFGVVEFDEAAVLKELTRYDPDPWAAALEAPVPSAPAVLVAEPDLAPWVQVDPGESEPNLAPPSDTSAELRRPIINYDEEPPF